MLDDIAHGCIVIEEELEVDVSPPVRQNENAVAVDVAVVALGNNLDVDLSVVELFEHEASSLAAIVRVSETTLESGDRRTLSIPLPNFFFAIPLGPANVSLTAIDEAIEVLAQGVVVAYGALVLEVLISQSA